MVFNLIIFHKKATKNDLSKRKAVKDFVNLTINQQEL